MTPPEEAEVNAASSRRRFIGMAGATLAAGAVSGCSSLSPETTTEATSTTTEALTSAATEVGDPVASQSVHQLQASYPFRGEHQEGVFAVVAPAGTITALDVAVETREELGSVLQALSEAAEAAMTSDELAGEGVSVVIGFGDSLFDDRFGLATQKPRELVPMPVFSNDSLVEQATSHGDLSLTVNAATQDAVDQVVLQLLNSVPQGALTSRWAQVGHNEVILEAGNREAPVRNLQGFKDGTVNVPPTSEDSMNSLVWVGEQDQQPNWAVGGTYQALRVIRMLLEPWEETPVETQETIIGRVKETGAPIGGDDEDDDPYFFDLDFNSHIGRVNSRMGGINAILRRGFNYTREAVDGGEPDQGLIFVSYQRSLQAGFIAMQQRLDGEALEQFIRPLHGGLFFVPPPPADGQYLGQGLVES